MSLCTRSHNLYLSSYPRSYVLFACPSFSFQAGSYGKPGGLKTIDFKEIDELTINADGTFELIVGPERPPNCVNYMRTVREPPQGQLSLWFLATRCLWLFLGQVVPMFVVCRICGEDGMCVMVCGMHSRGGCWIDLALPFHLISVTFLRFLSLVSALSLPVLLIFLNYLFVFTSPFRALTPNVSFSFLSFSLARSLFFYLFLCIYVSMSCSLWLTRYFALLSTFFLPRPIDTAPDLWTARQRGTRQGTVATSTSFSCSSLIVFSFDLIHSQKLSIACSYSDLMRPPQPFYAHIQAH